MPARLPYLGKSEPVKHAPLSRGVLLSVTWVCSAWLILNFLSVLPARLMFIWIHEESIDLNYEREEVSENPPRTRALYAFPNQFSDLAAKKRVRKHEAAAAPQWCCSDAMLCSGLHFFSDSDYTEHWRWWSLLLQRHWIDKRWVHLQSERLNKESTFSLFAAGRHTVNGRCMTCFPFSLDKTDTIHSFDSRNSHEVWGLVSISHFQAVIGYFERAIFCFSVTRSTLY